MIENYVSFETAKLLNEKGFDWIESPFYSEQDRDEWKCRNVYTVPNPLYNPDLPFDSETIALWAPHVSLQLAMKWLREVHKIFINISFRFSRNADNDINFSYYVEKYENHYGYGDGEFVSYEEAAEAAIKYCLENLI